MLRGAVYATGNRWAIENFKGKEFEIELDNGYKHVNLMNCGDVLLTILNQPQVQQIVRIPEEIAHLIYQFRKEDCNCIDCSAFAICENHATDDYTCEQAIIDWLTKKEV